MLQKLSVVLPQRGDSNKYPILMITPNLFLEQTFLKKNHKFSFKRVILRAMKDIMHLSEVDLSLEIRLISNFGVKFSSRESF